jgi:PleD family two-component response regulator
LQNPLCGGEKIFSYPRLYDYRTATNLIYDLPALIMAADEALSGLSILFVEDDADSRELLSLVLLNAAATVTAASNATDGYALYTASAPAVVVTDIAMPHRDGF